MDEVRYQLDLLKAMNQKLTGRERMYRLICDTSDNAFLYYNFAKNEIVTLGHWRDFFRFEIREVKDFSEIFEEVQDEYVLPLRDLIFLEKSGQNKGGMECLLKDGETWLGFDVFVTYDANGEAEDKVIRISNITKMKLKNEELRYMAYYDSLTGLYNRNYFVLRLGEFLQRAETTNSIVSVLFIDIDDFRKINDGMGLLVGDEVVQQFGQFLNGFSGENVLVCHMNTDVYCMAVYDPCGANSVETICRTIQERIDKEFILSTGQDVKLTVSIGVAEYPEAAKTPFELINCAEIVMFKAKEKGKAAVQYFDAPILQDFLNNVDIETKLKEAVLKNDFIMYFQPQYQAESGRLRGVEALIRWEYEPGKMLSPAVFIPLAEKNGSIVSIGNWVIDESLRCFAKWKAKYNYPLIISINISAIQYKRSDFVRNLTEVIKKYHIKPEEVELEITESVLIEDFEEVKEKLHILREYGVRISLDDFGTGFSSLSYLKGLPIDTLKIDKSFVDTIEGDASSRIITESIVGMVNKLGFESVAEGVETNAQLKYLKNIGCDMIQGYLMDEPMSEENIDKLLVKLL